LRPLRGIHERGIRHENERGPGLAKVACRLLGHSHARVSKLPKKVVVNTGCILGVCYGGASHFRSRDRTKRGHGINTGALRLFFCDLNPPQLVRHFFIGVKLDVVTRFFVGQFFLLETAVVETGDRKLGCTAGPLGNGDVAFARVGRQRSSGADESEALGEAKSHIEDCPVAKLGPAIVWIPARARHEYEIASPRIAQSVSAIVLNFNLVGFSRDQGLRKDDSEIRIFIFILLNEVQLLALLIFHAVNAKSAVKTQRHDSRIHKGPEGNHISRRHMRAFD
jgi:hypothetical protein